MAFGQDALIDRIYEAAAVPELWRDVLTDLGGAVGAEHSILVALRPGFARWIGSSPECEALVQAHFEQFPENERTRRLLALRHPGFVTDADVITESEMATEPVYRDFWLPQGYGNGVATAIFAPSGDTLLVHAECRRANGPVSRATVNRLDQLRPHFARALLLSARLEMQRAQATANALALIGLPAAVVASGGGLIAANAAFEEMIPGVVQDRKARVTLKEAASDELLADALAALSNGSADLAVRSIPVPSGAGHPPLIFHVVPIRGAAHDIFALATGVLVVTPVVPKRVPTASVVEGLFDLTPAEARLAAIIAAGYPPREAAQRLGVTEGTARTTLKRVLAKTGQHRQADLVALLCGTSVPN